MKTRFHGLLDFIIAILLILLPNLLSFPEGAPTTISTAVGVAIIVVGLMTKYEWGIVKVVPMNVHLAIDILLGFFLIISPWAFDFVQIISWPFAVFGSVEIIIAILTLGRPYKLHDKYQNKNIFMGKDY